MEAKQVQKEKRKKEPNDYRQRLFIQSLLQQGNQAVTCILTETQRQDYEQENFMRGKKKSRRLQVCPDDMGIGRLMRREVSCVFGQGCIVSFCWLKQSWKQDTYQGSYQLLIKSWLFGANCYRGYCLALWNIVQRQWPSFLQVWLINNRMVSCIGDCNNELIY